MKPTRFKVTYLNRENDLLSTIVEATSRDQAKDKVFQKDEVSKVLTATIFAVK